MLQLIWNYLAYIGTALAKDTSEHKHILLVNSLALFLTVFFTINLFQMIAFSYPTIGIISSILYVLLLPFTVVLNSMGKFTSARFFLISLSFLYITLTTILIGNSGRGHFYYLTEIFVVFFVFPPYRKKRIFSTITFLFLAFSIFEIFHSDLKPLVTFDPQTLKIQQIVYNFIFGSILVAFSFYIHSIFRKAELTAQLEHDKSQKLLQNILPLSVIAKLRDNPDTIAENFEECTVLFSDIVGFTEMSRKMSAYALVSLLNEVFSSFDDLAEKHNLEKIKTIGDAYMVVGGLPEPDPNHAENVAQFALEMQTVIQGFKQKMQIPLELRIGIHSGGAVAGVIGKKKFIYDLWGDSVNTASRMESHGLPGQIHVSESTYNRLKEKFQFKERGMVTVKGIGNMKSYFLIQKFV
ncbi:MAG: adenylate/guanylate cyclase domain-containing protein [Leptospiraceae bacterium]|nr:adenylate/guanylate cyclase domain-containing protein [Leptospiraceae bacterium]MCP5496889.1 adenylate/guanylate cyclase domain-containing protein [Leptospiraceae bacterium]